MISYQISNNATIINKDSLPLLPQLELLNNDYPTGVKLVWKNETGWRNRVIMNLKWQRQVTISKNLAQWNNEILNPYIGQWINMVANKLKISSQTIFNNLFKSYTFYYYIEFLSFLFETALATAYTLNNATYYDEYTEEEKYKYDSLTIQVELNYNMGILYNEDIIQIIRNGKVGSISSTSHPMGFNWQIIKTEKPPVIRNETVFMFGFYKIDLIGDFNDNLSNKKIYFLKNRYYQEDR